MEVKQSPIKLPFIPFPEFFAAVAVFLFALCIVRPFTPGMEQPLNDDWVYAKDVFHIFQSGEFHVTGFESAWGIPQLFSAAWLSTMAGFSQRLLRLYGVISLTGCLFCLNLLMRPVIQSALIRFFGLLSFTFFIPTFYLTTTFMTDLPFLLLWLITCILWEHAFQTKSLTLLASGGVLASLSFAERQFGLFLLCAAVMVFTLKSFVPFLKMKRVQARTADKMWIGGSLAIFALTAVAMAWTFGWWNHHNAQVPGPALSLQIDLRAIYGNLNTMWIYLGWASLLVIPFYATKKNLFPRYQSGRLLTIRATLVLLVTFVVLRPIIITFHGHYMPYLKNLFSPLGFFTDGEVLSGERPVIVDGVAAVALTLVTVLSGALSVALGFRAFGASSLRNKIAGYGGTTLIASLLYCSFISIRLPVFDRYLLPLIPIFFISIFCGLDPVLSRWRVMVSGALAVISLAFAVTLSADYMRWNEAKWAAAQFAVSEGKLEADEIHAGYEWHGMHYLVPLSHPPVDTSGFSAVVSFSALPPYTVWKTFPYFSYWSPHNRNIYLLRNK